MINCFKLLLEVGSKAVVQNAEALDYVNQNFAFFYMKYFLYLLTGSQINNSLKYNVK